MTGEMLNENKGKPVDLGWLKRNATPTGREKKLRLAGSRWCSWHVNALRFDASGHADETKEEAADS